MKRDKKKECITKKIIGQNTFKVSVPRKKIHSKKKGNYEEQMGQVIEKYAQAIREIRKKRNQENRPQANYMMTDNQQPYPPNLPSYGHMTQQTQGNQGGKTNNRHQFLEGRSNDCLLYTSRCV